MIQSPDAHVAVKWSMQYENKQDISMRCKYTFKCRKYILFSTRNQQFPVRKQRTRGLRKKLKKRLTYQYCDKANISQKFLFEKELRNAEGFLAALETTIFLQEVFRPVQGCGIPDDSLAVTRKQIVGIVFRTGVHGACAVSSRRTPFRPGTLAVS